LTLNSLAVILSAVSTIAEIEAVLPKLTAEELVRVEQAVHSQFRQRGGGIIYDDTHGVETEADLIASADEAFQAYDKAEAAHAKRKTR
jgi:hypothetical protein